MNNTFTYIVIGLVVVFAFVGLIISGWKEKVYEREFKRKLEYIPSAPTTSQDIQWDACLKASELDNDKNIISALGLSGLVSWTHYKAYTESYHQERIPFAIVVEVHNPICLSGRRYLIRVVDDKETT